MSLHGKTVLIVDDEERNLFALGSYLESRDMNVITAHNGQEALRILSEPNSVAVVLLDMMMPVMDGYETLSIARNDEQLKKLPFIALTARAMKGDKEKCLEAGAWDYLSKPADLTLLITKLEHWTQ